MRENQDYSDALASLSLIPEKQFDEAVRMIAPI